MSKNLAIIPARSGSKGLKDKNILPLAGIPLMGYSISAALQSCCFDTVMVSTNSEEYALIAKECGAEVPFLRSEVTSTDTASTWDTVREVLKNYRELGEEFDCFMILQPTSPLRDAGDIIAAFKLLNERNANAVVSVCLCEHSPYWSAQLPADGNMVVFHELFEKCKARQLLGQPYYRLNGAIYLVCVPYFEYTPDIYTANCFAYVMSRENSVDIDNSHDFNIAEFLIEKKQN